MPRKKIQDALGRLAAAEEQFLKEEFLAPVLRGGHVAVRIAGVVCNIRVRPPDFQGFGVFRPTSHSDATLLREAKLSERRRYLELFPRVLLVVCRKEQKKTFALPMNSADARFAVQGEILEFF